MRLDQKEMKEKIQELKKDVENGELTAMSWLWIIGGGMIGFVLSCIQWSKKEIKPIMAKFEKAEKSGE
jgi:hypothetical protein